MANAGEEEVLAHEVARFIGLLREQQQAFIRRGWGSPHIRVEAINQDVWLYPSLEGTARADDAPKIYTAFIQRAGKHVESGHIQFDDSMTESLQERFDLNRLGSICKAFKSTTKRLNLNNNTKRLVVPYTWDDLRWRGEINFFDEVEEKDGSLVDVVRVKLANDGFLYQKLGGTEVDARHRFATGVTSRTWVLLSNEDHLRKFLPLIAFALGRFGINKASMAEYSLFWNFAHERFDFRARYQNHVVEICFEPGLPISRFEFSYLPPCKADGFVALDEAVGALLAEEEDSNEMLRDRPCWPLRQLLL